MALKDVLNNNKMLSPKSQKFIIVPLHSTLSSEEQSLVFKKPQKDVRKIVLSTNIAETSVTIDDCVFVIDTGKMKETRFDFDRNMESLDMCWVSRANAMQRMGELNFFLLFSFFLIFNIKRMSNNLFFFLHHLKIY